jgi:oligosaccharide reducing-end xylanase
MPSGSSGRAALVSLLAALWASACLSAREDAPEGSGGSATATGGKGGTGGTGGATGGKGGTGGTTGGKGGTGANGGKGGSGAAGTPGACPRDPVPNPNGTSNLFADLLCKTQAEVDAKVSTAVDRFFGIGTGESSTPAADTGYRCYYELPQDTSMAFIWAADSNDVRSEGMSYGMLIAVQTDRQAQFDKLWKFSKTYMQFPANTGTTSFKYYFRWQGTVSHGGGGNWGVNFGADIPAPDGDEYFAAALYLADARWGSSGGVNYKQEADDISAAMLHNGAANSRFPIIHSGQNMVVFVPYGNSNNFTDPSYHLPGFYELFAERGPSADSAKWRSVAATSRTFLQRSAHATTGLHPDYAQFSGQPTTAQRGDGHDEFRYDAWRVVLNMAIDHAWYGEDAGMKAQIEKYHAFFSTRLESGNVSNSLFRVDGSNASGGGSTALTATLAAGSLASTHAARTTYVQNLWNVPQQSGTYRYYQETVYLMGLLAVAGKYNHTW